MGQLVQEVKFPDINERVIQSAVGTAGSTVVHVVCFGIPEDAGGLEPEAPVLMPLENVNIETLVAVIDPSFACVHFFRKQDILVISSGLPFRLTNELSRGPQ